MVARKAIINAGRVENVIIADDDFAIPDRDLVTVPDKTPVSAGWIWAGGKFTAPEPVAPNPADHPLLPWQFKAMVIFLGIDDQVQIAIGGIPNAMQRAAAMSRYLNASYYRYDDALLQSMRAAIGMSNETFTDAWMQAKDLTSGA